MSVRCNTAEFEKLVKEEKRLRKKLQEALAKQEAARASEIRLGNLKAKVQARPTSVAEAEARQAWREANPIQEVITNAMKNVGSNDMLTSSAVNTLRNPASAVDNPYFADIDDMIEQTLGIHLNANITKNLSNETRALLESTQERLRALISDNRYYAISSDEQKAKIVKRLSEHLEDNKQVWLRQLEDESLDGFWFGIDNKTGAPAIEFHMLAKSTGKPFTHQRAAELAAKNYQKNSSLKGLEMKAVERNGEWVVKARRVISNEELEAGKFQDLAGRASGGMGVSRWIRDHKSMVDEELGQSGLIGTLQRERLASETTKILNEALKPVSKKQVKDVEKLLDEARLSGEYYEPAQLQERFIQLIGRPMSKGETNLYYTVKLMEDMVNYSRNVSRWSELDSLGYKTITLKKVVTRELERGGEEFDELADVDFTGKILSREQTPQNIEEYGVFDIAGRNLLQSDRTSIESLFDQGYRLVELEDSAKLNRQIADDVGSVKYVLVAPKQFKENALHFQQIKPRVGGFKNFEDVSHFVTINPTVTLSSGKKVAKQPKVLRGAKNEKSAKQFANKINAGLKILRSVKPTGKKLTWRDVTPAQIDEINAQIRQLDLEGMDNLVQFRDFVLRNEINLEGGVTFSRRESLVETSYIDEAGDRIEALNAHVSPDEALQRAYLGSRSGGLLMVDGTNAISTNPIRALQQQVNKVITDQSFRDFKVNQVNRFKSTFKDFVTDPTASALEMATTGQLLSRELLEAKARLMDLTPEQLINTFKSHQAYINQVLRTDNAFDAQVKSFMYSLAGRVESPDIVNKYLAKGQEWLTTKLYNGAQTNPIDKLRSLTFNVKLGMFSPVQFLQQAQGAALAFSMSPKYGFQAAASYMPMRMAIRMGDEESIRHVAEKTYRLAGFESADEFADMVILFKQSGYSDFSTSMAMADSGYDTAARSSFGRGMQRVAEVGRKPFEEGELISRITGFNIAYRRWLNNDNGVNPKGLSAKTPEAIKYLSKETDRVLFSPLAENNPLFTKGWLSIPFQFWSHNAKVLNAMLPKKLGGNTRYNSMEKFQIAMGGALFYGTTHVPLATSLVNFFVEHSGVELEPAVAKQLHDGLFDTLMYVASDGKIDGEAGVRWGAWSMIDQVYERYVKGEATVGDVAEFITGATGSTVRQALVEPLKMMSALSVWENPRIDNITEVGITTLGGVLASVGMGQRVYLAQKYNLMFDKRYGAASPITSQEAWYMLFTGGQPSASNQMFRDIADSKTRRIKMEESAQVIQTLLNKIARSSSSYDRQRYEEALSLYSLGLGHDKFAQDTMSFALQRFSKGGTLSQVLTADRMMNNDVRPALERAKAKKNTSE